MLAFDLKQVRNVSLYWATRSEKIVAKVLDRIVDTVETETGRAGLVSPDDCEWLSRHQIEAQPVEQVICQ